MSKIKFHYPSGATPLDPNETSGLIPGYISDQNELNILEKENITEALNWAKSKKHADVLTVGFALDLHKRMFGRVWKWAGQPRRSNKNIGVMWEQISTQLGLLFQDTQYWIQNNTYSRDEAAARFHHRMVAIHAFANGNGRHARLMTNILLEANDEEPFTWGAKTDSTPIETKNTTRQKYISALRAADRGDLNSLLLFVKT